MNIFGHSSKIKVDIGAFFLALILCVLIATGVFLLNSLKIDIVAETIDSDSLIKILFVFEHDGRALFTDVFLYYPKFKRGAVFSIPGNTGAIYRSLGKVDRIDEVYNQKGIDVYRTEIETLLDQSLPFTVTISLDSLCDLTDILGGLRIVVTSPVDEVRPDGERWLLPSGAVTLDGDKIRTYATYSLADESSADKQEREQSVIVSLLTAMHEQQALFTKENFRAIYPLFSANLEEKDLMRLLAEIAQINTDHLIPQPIIGTLRDTSDGKQLLFPLSDGQFIKDAVKQSAGKLVSQDEETYSRIYALEIQNGTTVQGLARNTSILLQNIGYDVRRTINADSQDIEKTVIYNHIGIEEAAKNLGDFIHCANIIIPDVQSAAEGGESELLIVDLTLVLGKDFDGRYVR
ncbi:MAG: LCP family protein [Treponemataceae bacterium]|nr:MAG: LCP family protein [Treponemataceae bacterium]